jgi:hypothetical protein
LIPDEECTSGAITQVTISDPTFPFDYTTAAQFNSCLSATTTRDNLAAITQAVDDTEYLRIVLDKLQEVGHWAGWLLLLWPWRQ